MSDTKPQSEPSMEEILASINRMIGDEKKPEEGIARPAAEPKNDVLELTEAMSEDGTVRRITPKGPSTAERIEPEPPRAAAGDPVAPATEPKPDPAARNHVRSAAAAGATAAALGRLAAMPRADRKPEERMPEEYRRSDGAPTLEEVVREALQPLIRAWLDEHLPELAEKMAREEIARVLQEAGLR
jgi:cell pole-organizing protein PopZ